MQHEYKTHPNILYLLPVTPLLAPLTFGRDVVDSGDFAQLSCIAMKGDEPMSISWSFHGAKGDPGPGILTTPIGNITIPSDVVAL